MGVCNCSMYCCTLLYVHSSIAIILMGKRELIALLNLSSWCLVMVERRFLAVPRGCLQFVIVVFPDHTYYFWYRNSNVDSRVERFLLQLSEIALSYMSLDMRFPTMWYVRPAKAQISLRIRAV